LAIGGSLEAMFAGSTRIYAGVEGDLEIALLALV
jgi:hypothetical protein